MKLLQVRRRVITYAAMVIAFAGASARADVVAVSPAAFPGIGTTLITFTGLGSVEVNGLVFGGVQFSYSLGNDQLIIDGGLPPGANNVSAPNIITIGDATGVLTMVLPSLQNLFGFGYAVLSALPMANATTITLFNNAMNVGALSYNAAPDPLFAGGFAGIQSTLAFNRVQVTFNPAAGGFAVDNIRFANVIASPEPATLALVFTGFVAVGFLRRRRPATPV